MIGKFPRLLISVLMIIVDAALLQASYVISFYIRYLGHPPTFNLTAYTEHLPMLCLLGPISVYMCGLYGIKRRAWSIDAERVLKSALLFSLIVMASTFMIRAFSFPRTVLVLAIPFQIILMLIWRRYVWLYIKLPKISKLVVVGTSHEVKEVLDKVGKNQTEGYVVSACILVGSDDDCLPEIADEIAVPVLGRLQDIDLLVKTESYDGTILCSSVSSEVKHEVTLKLIDNDKVVLIIPTLYEAIISSSSLAAFDDLPLIPLHDSDSNTARASVKRVIDVVLSLITLIVGAPLIIIIAVAIKVSSPKGPIFLRQERVGYGDKNFTLFKFRTMIPDAEKYSGPVFASDKDPRITPLGGFLRAIRLDELPQFYNILRGDMSIVGPRPERPFFVKQFTNEIPEYHLRHKVPVGLTGLAQVMGNYDTEMKNKLKYDLAYMGSWTLTDDFLIMLRTAGVMVTKGKAR